MTRTNLKIAAIAIGLAFSNSAAATQNQDCLIARSIFEAANLEMEFAQSRMHSCYDLASKNPKMSSGSCAGQARAAASMIGDVLASRSEARTICKASKANNGSAETRLKASKLIVPTSRQTIVP